MIYNIDAMICCEVSITKEPHLEMLNNAPFLHLA